MEIFEEKFKPSMTQDEAIKLGLEALMGATEEGSLNTLAVEIGLVKKKEPFQKLDPKKVVKLVGDLKKQ